MVSDRKLANAVGGRSARACDNCVKKRARWYCAADDAFLCQSCDSSVHSANPLARRHERVRLKTASSNSFDDESKPKLQPSWEQGFTRKARTPRQKKQGKFNPLHLVPEMCSEEQSVEENEVQLLYRVPIFDPFEFAVNPVRNDDEYSNNRPGNDDSKTASYFSTEMSRLEGIDLPSELDLADFAADVESLLGKGLEDESFDMEELGLSDCHDYGKLVSRDCSLMVKVEDEEIGERIDVDFDVGRETFELNLDFGSCGEDDEEENKAQIRESKLGDDSNKTFLKLDYEGVMSAWDDQKSPWTTGQRPELNSGDCWPEYLGTSGAMHVYGVEMGTGTSGQAWAGRGDGGREARVMRYREKRRTRLFSKKIRYEVRKLNAEKRPRMKGRFVKRASFASSALPLLNK
ncbi:hypothetical protein ACS0TY_008327 [Phlomoides rotata]